mgnify:CR=1 FL=1|jgi:hypothetical protein
MKSCSFIRVSNPSDGQPNELIYVPPPSSVMGGMARRAWLIKYFKGTVTIASKERWKQLQEYENCTVYYLVEEQGVYRECLTIPEQS